MNERLVIILTKALRTLAKEASKSVEIDSWPELQRAIDAAWIAIDKAEASRK